MPRMTVERFFGGIDHRISYLQSTLQYVSEYHPSHADLSEWILQNTPAGSQQLIRRNIAFLETIDLIEETDGRYEPTTKGEAVWKRDEPLVLYEGLATNVDGFRDLCRAIQAGNRTVEAIQTALRESFPDFELPEGVVGGHLGWLRSLGLVTKFDGTYSFPIEDGTFDVGESYNRWFIHDVLKGERYKGIATPSDLDLVLLFTGESGSAYGYEDTFLPDDRFVYTGEGVEGDMTMDGGNAAIRHHRENGDSLHLFESTDMPWIVTYLGEYEYEKHVIDTLPDEHGTDRDAIRFTLAPAGGTKVELEDGTPQSLSLDDLYEKATESSPTHTTGSSSGSTSESRSYQGSAVVREYALRWADGVCQGCDEDAPFLTAGGDPYLEVHHLTRRSDGGPDDPDNVIALCPNCHRRVHEGRDGDAFNRKLKRRVANRDS
ncbi:HNH endonuclease [Halovivax cerinus]|uniref:HNH endonuclease n=1 Tax=Halovivax cerinus TaxID=1487865 RepID=A0ABD5NRF2_9EURY|nr:HNH endonuclease signature motif containing protein [Halovivax cerinus]